MWVVGPYDRLGRCESTSYALSSSSSDSSVPIVLLSNICDEFIVVVDVDDDDLVGVGGGFVVGVVMQEHALQSSVVALGAAAIADNYLMILFIQHNSL
jgi:hypothetical protein